MARLETVDIPLVDKTGGFLSGDNTIAATRLPDSGEVLGYRVKGTDLTGGFSVTPKWVDPDASVADLTTDNAPDTGFSLAFASATTHKRVMIRRNFPQHFFPSEGSLQVVLNITGSPSGTSRLQMWAITRKGSF